MNVVRRVAVPVAVAAGAAAVVNATAPGLVQNFVDNNLQTGLKDFYKKENVENRDAALETCKNTGDHGKRGAFGQYQCIPQEPSKTLDLREYFPSGKQYITKQKTNLAGKVCASDKTPHKVELKEKPGVIHNACVPDSRMNDSGIRIID